MDQGFSNFTDKTNLSRILSNTDSDSRGQGWGARICFSNKLPGDADAAGPQATFRVARLY